MNCLFPSLLCLKGGLDGLHILILDACLFLWLVLLFGGEGANAILTWNESRVGLKHEHNVPGHGHCCHCHGTTASVVLPAALASEV